MSTSADQSNGGTAEPMIPTAGNCAKAEAPKTRAV